MLPSNENKILVTASITVSRSKPRRPRSPPQPSWSLGSLTLHHHFGRETFDIAKDRRDRKHPAVAFVAYQAVLCRHIAVDRQFVPSLGMTHAVDWDVIVLAPKERHRCELLATSEHVERRRLPLAFGDDPVLHPDVLAAMRIRPARDVSSGIDSRDAGFEIGVHNHPTVERQSSLCGKIRPRADPDAFDHKVGVERAATLEHHSVGIYGAGSLLEVKHDTVFFMQGAHKVTKLRAQNAFHGPLLRRNHMDFNVARAQRSCDFEPNEACTQYDRATRAFGALHDGATIGERTQRVHRRPV